MTQKLPDTLLPSTGAPASASPAETWPRKRVGWHPVWGFALGALVLLTLALRYAQPIVSTDMWWQMAYGRDLLANRTLVPDHTAYTWTPAQGTTIYCAWLAEIPLFLVHALGGVPFMIALRYLALLGFVAILGSDARRRDVAAHPFTWLTALAALLMSYTGTHVKPEMFSLLYMTFTVHIWLSLRDGSPAAWRRCYLLPLCMLCWVNSHGAFIFGLLFLGIAWLGETMNALYRPDRALALRVRQHLLLALVLTGLAVFLTPYGWHYPLQLPRDLVHSSTRGLLTVRAYDTIFCRQARPGRFVEYLALGLTVLAVLALPAIRRRRVDWALLLPNLVFAVLYTRFLRTTYLWAPVFALTAIELLGREPRWLTPVNPQRRALLGTVVALLCLAIGSAAVYEHATRANNYAWLGFGVSHFNPVEEAEFIRTHYPGRKIGNDYTGGGYLLWRLTPDTRIFIDPRAFPFQEWYPEYTALRAGNTALLRKYPADVFCTTFLEQNILGLLQRSETWRPAFFGPSAAVFVNTETMPAPEHLAAGQGIADIRNLDWALFVLKFALNNQDLQHAEQILTGLQRRFRLPHQRRRVAAAEALYRGIQAYHCRRYGEAEREFRAASAVFGKAVDRTLAVCRAHLAVQLWQAGSLAEAAQMAQTALDTRPDDVMLMYNAGVMQWYASSRKAAADGTRPESGQAADLTAAAAWRKNLQHFLTATASDLGYPREPVAAASAILQDRFDQRPPLIRPPHPPTLPEPAPRATPQS